ncbi:MAG: polymer-forming cytoskeletal protein [Minisyncoccales bacterium]
MIKKYFVVLVSVICVFPLAFSSAMTVTEKNINLPQGEIINDEVLLVGNNITVNSDVVGNIYAFGQKVYINGNVDGDIIGAAQSIVVNGNVTGNIRTASQSIEINGKVERSVSAVGQDIILSVDSLIERNVLFAAETVDIAGNVIGSVNVIAETLNISGKVNNNVNFYSNMAVKDNSGLILTPTAVISGDISYNAFGDIKGVSQVNVLGSIEKNIPEMKQEEMKRGIWSEVAFLLLTLLTCLMIVLVGGKKVKDVEKIMTEKTWKSFGIGFAVLICTPILAFLFFVTGLGGLIGTILIMIWMLMLLLAYFFSAISFGQYLLKIIKKDFKQSFLVYSLIGVVVGYVLLAIPFIGFFVGLFGLCWGIGGMYLSFLESRKEIKAA